MGTSGNRDCQLALRGVLKDFTEDELKLVVCLKMGQPEWRKRVSDSGYTISDSGTYMRGCAVLCGLDG